MAEACSIGGADRVASSGGGVAGTSRRPAGREPRQLPGRHRDYHRVRTFNGLAVNGRSIADGTRGFLFHLANTSYCLGSDCGGAAAFEQDPDGDFAVADVLTAHSAEEIAERQPFGIYRFGTPLPKGSGLITSSPSGFAKKVETANADTVEVNFEIDLRKSISGFTFEAAGRSGDPD